MEHKGLRPLIHPGFFRQSLRGRSLAAPLSLSIRVANCPGHRFCRGPGRAFGGRRIQTVALQWAILPDVHAAGAGASGGGGLRYPRWMAFCDCRRPPFSPALPVSTPTPPAGAAAGSSAGHFRPADKAAAPPAVQFRSVYASRPCPWHSRQLNSRRNTFTPAPPAYFHPSSGLRPPPPQWPAPGL